VRCAGWCELFDKHNKYVQTELRRAHFAERTTITLRPMMLMTMTMTMT
jgi:hypothetical protein